MIYVSTGLIKKKTIMATVNHLINGGIENIEMSGGNHDSKVMSKIKKLKSKANFALHNYFPPPKKPFTLNLASSNKDIYNMCRKHVVKSIRYTSEIGAKFYTFHGGFLIDPSPKELGKPLSQQKRIDEKLGTKLFVERIHYFSDFAYKHGVELLVENNVLTKKNLKVFKKNPLLMTTTDQTLKLVKKFPKNVNLLVDLAHLKVSAKTLKFSPINFLKRCDKWIKAYHISDNQGLFDTNETFSKKSWFWPYLKKDRDYYTLELKTSDIRKIKSQIKLLNNFIKKN